ncbi:acyl carrier protein [Chloroflexota bacterium]
MIQSTEDRLYRIISEVFGVPAAEINNESSPDTIETWDSLSHLNLVLALEEEFGVSLSPEDVMEMLSVQLIRTILAERGVKITK